MTDQTVVLVTGGAGFIGSAVIRNLLTKQNVKIVNVDLLTYAGNPATIRSFDDHENYSFEKIDIRDAAEVSAVFEKYAPQYVMHLAAESHVDRSIDGPADFISTNIVGTYTLLEAFRSVYKSAGDKQSVMKFHHVSTDEVFGSLGDEGLFTEASPYQPNSPYSASKASSDHLVRAWGETYNLPVVVSNCSNNYGPFQFPEKLIPVVMSKALSGAPIPVYGDGKNVRDWLFVGDHAAALIEIMFRGNVGETYNVGGNAERTNLQVVHTICDELEKIKASGLDGSYRSLIEFVTDRPGHDFRYAIDASKLKKELGWEPTETFESGIYKTIRWYLDNQPWVKEVQGAEINAGRLGLGGK